MLPVHRRAHHEGHLGVLVTRGLDLREEVVKHWFKTQSKSAGALGGRQEVGHAGDDAHVRLLPNGTQVLGQDLDLRGWQKLGRQHTGTISTVERVKMSLDIGVADDCEDPLHREARRQNNSSLTFLVLSDLIGSVFYTRCIFSFISLLTLHDLMIYAPKDDFRK